MTATDELRRMLDERGVEWHEPPMKPNKTWFPDSNGINCCARPWSDKLEIRRHALTPEQAIAATLGDAGNGKERPLYFNLADEESDERVVVRKSELVRCLKHFREEILSSPGDYEHDMRDIGGRLWAADTATLGSGRLTADQLRECVGSVYLEGYSDGSANRGAHIDETDWHAIADELNALVGLDNGVERSNNGVTRYSEMFGTSERAARTIKDKMLTYDLLDQCDKCPHFTDECYEVGAKCAMDDYGMLLEWLKGSDE